MKYKIETLLAIQTLKKKIIDIIKHSIINEEELTLEFDIDLRNVKGKHIHNLSDVLWGRIDYQYMTLVASEMLAEGYMCIPIQGGWIVLSPKEEYQLGDNSCTCSSFIYENIDEPCKHLLFRDWHNHYRARINQEKINKGYT